MRVRQRTGKECTKAHCFGFFCFVFFPGVKYICLQPLWKAHKEAWQLKTCSLYVSISLCDMQGKMLFFYPQPLFTWRQVSKSTHGSKERLIKVTIWKEHTLTFNQSVLRENAKLCARGSGSQLSALKWERGECTHRSTQEGRWISQLNLPVIKLYLYTELRGVHPNYYSFEKCCCFQRLIQNGGRCRE